MNALQLSLRRSRASRGFTLLEIMLVVTIIILLLGTAIKYLSPAIGFGQDVRLQGDFQTISTALRTYQGVYGFLPTTEQGVQALVSAPQSEPKPTGWRQLLIEVPKDPWQQEYVYVQPGKHNPDGFDLYSKGKDRIADTEDDVPGNWKK